MSKKKTGHSKKSKDWLGRPIIEHFNSKGEKTSYSRPSKNVWGTPITEHYNSKGEKTGYNKKSETVWGTPRTDRHNSQGEKTGYNAKSETVWGTPITERYNSKGEKTGYSAKSRNFWGTPITEHYTDAPSAPSEDSPSDVHSSTQDERTGETPVTRSGATPVWARVAGCIAGFVFAEVAGPIVSRVILSVQAQPAQWLGACGVAWLAANTILVGVAVTGALSARKQMAKWAAALGTALTILLVVLVAVAGDRSTRGQEGSPVSSSVAFPPDRRPKASVTAELVDQMAEDIPEVRTCLDNSSREDVLAALDTEVLHLRRGRTTLLVSGDGKEPCRLFGARRPMQWIYEKSGSGYRQLLNVGPVDSVIVLGGEHNGYKDIQLSASFKVGTEVYMETYVFAGKDYRRTGDGQTHPIVADAGAAGGNPNHLPQNIRKLLDDEYPGWFFPTVSAGDLKVCRQPNPGFSPGIVWGDFDGDGTRDYGVAIQQGERRYTLAFLDRGSGFARFELEPGGWNILGVVRKGEIVPQVGQDAHGNLVAQDPVTLQNDALIGMKCESASVAYLWGSGGFQSFFMSD